MHNNKVLMFYQ